MKWYETYIFIILAGFVGYCLAEVPGFLFGVVWSSLVVLILALFSRSN